VLAGVGSDAGGDDSSSLYGRGEGGVGSVVAVRRGFGSFRHLGYYCFGKSVDVAVGWDWEAGSVLLVVGVF